MAEAIAINPTHADDLRTVYGMAVADIATSPVEIATDHPAINTRYARELLGVLVSHDLLMMVETAGGDVWQPTHNEEAITAFNTLLAEIPAPKPATNGVTRTAAKRVGSYDKDGNPITCLCGCGIQVTGKSSYKPGHDARHAGEVARALVDLGTDGASSHLDALGSDKLREKALRIADGMRAKAAGKKAKPVTVAVPTPTTEWVPSGVIKIGRWEYPTRVLSGGAAAGMMQRNTKQDGTGDWTEVK